MIIDTIDKFVDAVPTAGGTEYSAIRPFLEEADADVIDTLIGMNLYSLIEGLEDNNRTKIILRNLIACDAYARAIPFVDLLQTNNGFAVVNSSNMAPASKERVERLITQCKRTVYSCADILISQVMQGSQARTEWAKFILFNELTNCLFLTGKEWANYSEQLSTTREDYIKVKPQLLSLQNTIIAQAISKNYLSYLIEKIRTGALSNEKDIEIINSCKIILGNLVSKNNDTARNNISKLIYTIESDIDNYPVYKASPEYLLKSKSNFENSMDSPVFFFGL